MIMDPRVDIEDRKFADAVIVALYGKGLIIDNDKQPGDPS